MEWIEGLENINYAAVLLGIVVSMVLGALWYSPAVFGKQWMKMIGFKKKDMENRDGMPVMMTMSVLFYALVSVVIAMLFESTDSAGAGEGLLLGAVLGFVFGFGPLAVTYVYARRKFELTVIDGGYIVVTCALIGAVVGRFS